MHREDAGLVLVAFAIVEPTASAQAGALLAVAGFFLVPIVGLFIGFPLSRSAVRLRSSEERPRAARP